MQIVLNVENESISQKVLASLSSYTKNKIDIKTLEENKKLFLGMWKDRDADVNKIRESAWK